MTSGAVVEPRAAGAKDRLAEAKSVSATRCRSGQIVLARKNGLVARTHVQEGRHILRRPGPPRR